MAPASPLGDRAAAARLHGSYGQIPGEAGARSRQSPGWSREMSRLDDPSIAALDAGDMLGRIGELGSELIRAWDASDELVLPAGAESDRKSTRLNSSHRY